MFLFMKKFYVNKKKEKIVRKDCLLEIPVNLKERLKINGRRKTLSQLFSRPFFIRPVPAWDPLIFVL